MKLAFMSSVFPPLTVAELISKARQHGCEGLEFRPEWKQAHGVEVEVSGDTLKAARQAIAAADLEACCLSPGVSFGSMDREEHSRQLANLRRMLGLAREMGIPRIRVFGDPIPDVGRGAREAIYRLQAESLLLAAREAREAGVILCLETHGNFRAFDAGEVLHRAGYPPALRVNWHLGHCLRHGEDVDEAYRHVKGLVAHVHFNIGEEKVMPTHLERQAELLLAEGYSGFFSVEVIKPPDGDQALKAHAAFWQELRKKLGF
jgi:sugar phosphate isomerase/epimerase